MNDSATAIGSERIGSSALRRCSRKRMITEADDDRLLDERALERVDRALDEVGAVVGDHDLDALREAAGLSSSSFSFTRSMTSSAFSP